MTAAEKQYPFFQKIILDWFQGMLTTTEVLTITKDTLHIEGYEPGFSDLVSEYEIALELYHEAWFMEWQEYKEYAKDTAPTVAGLVHQLQALTAEEQTLNDFLEWATWHNVDGGESTSGVFENTNIEYFCLIFLPSHQHQLHTGFFEKAIPIIANSNDVSYGAFVIAIHLLLDKEYKSLYYFLGAYIDGSKTDAELNQYLEKKFNHKLPAFRYDISKFPYLDQLHDAREHKTDITDFMQLMTL